MWKKLFQSTNNGVKTMMIPPPKELLDMLQCPLSKGRLVYVPSIHEVVSPVARIGFPVSESGIINLCPHDGRVLRPDENYDQASE
jgi:uncharacterized protein YbaR (Trm112 family)